jgi:hypothetical protein
MDAINDLPADLSLVAPLPARYWVVQARWRFSNMQPSPNFDPIVRVTFPLKPFSDEAEAELYRRLGNEGHHHAVVYDLELYSLRLARGRFDESFREQEG